MDNWQPTIGGSACRQLDKHAVVLLSGGLDSATVLAIATSQGYACHALSFDYGQRHRVELEASHAVAQHLGVEEHRTIHLDLRAFGGSALTDEIAVPKGGTTGIPVTYVPARNTIFLAYGLAWAEVLGCGDIFVGVNAIDYSGYPDCRPEYIEAFERMANLATKASVEGELSVRIHTPLIEWTKAQIIKVGTSLGVDYGLTRSCYDPDDRGLACGGCDSCLLRKRGFQEAGVADPTQYRKNPTV